MTCVSYNPLSIPDALQSMYLRMVENWRQDDAILDSLFIPSLSLTAPNFNQSFNALARSFSSILRLRDSMLGGMDVNLYVVEKRTPTGSGRICLG